ncbi:hypothetical protein SGCZBJ_25195 [Caulobacter zeae]|uniref:Capsule biosynthesis protein n=1 Tax=Caulobacter zeae TaxID=2055137 RepID=A0A2N5CYQ2_9CAUL|nr:DUF6356 family protein [Caulobacter zeae]PLR18931.1 hypothetical protein SGCZBJ_25195 [Caulobacter zeae]
MLELFTRHPKQVGETYGEHFAMAWSFGLPMVAAGLACLVHGILPFAFERTGSNCVKTLHARMKGRGAPTPTPAPISFQAFDAAI